jgi:hypothetical protein
MKLGVKSGWNGLEQKNLKDQRKRSKRKKPTNRA